MGKPCPSLVERFTGAPLQSQGWVAKLEWPLEEAGAREKKEYAAGLLAGPARAAGIGADLNMRVRLVDGDTLISDSGAPGGDDACPRLASATATFAEFLRGRAA